MGLYVVAIEFKHNCYRTFRLVDSLNGTVKDISAQELFQCMTRGQNKVTVKAMYVDYNKLTLRFMKGFDDSRLCVIDEVGQPVTNKDGMVVTGIDGDYVYLANYTGQIIKAHMLQVGNAVKNKKSVLVNATIQEKGRITLNELTRRC